MHLSPGRAFGAFVQNRSTRWQRSIKIDELDASGGAAAFTTAEQALDGPDRLRAIKALARVDPERAQPILRTLSESPDKWTRRIALQVMRETTGRAMWPQLLELVKDADQSVALDAFRGLDQHAGAGDVAELLGLVDQVSSAQAKRLLSLANRIERAS